MTNLDALQQAVGNIIKNAPDFDLNTFIISKSKFSFLVLGTINNEAAFKIWANRPYNRPKKNFGTILDLPENPITKAMLDCLDNYYNNGSDMEAVENVCLDSENNPMPNILPGDILFVRDLCRIKRYIKLDGDICFDTIPKQDICSIHTVRLRAIEPSIEKIMRAGKDNVLRTIWEK